MASPFTKVVANFSTTLVTAITAGGTSATLGGNTTKEGVALPTGKYCFTVNQGKSNEQHFVCDLAGTAITNIQGVDRLGNVTTGALKDAQINDEIKITDYVNLLRLVEVLTGVTPLDGGSPIGYDVAPVLSNPLSIATVQFVLDNINGGPVSFNKQTISGTAGESVSIRDILYFKESDQRWYKLGNNTIPGTEKIKVGFSETAASSGSGISVTISGLISGFTGLTAGSKYYTSGTVGTLTTTPVSYSMFIGIAMSSTTILLSPEYETVVNDDTTQSATQVSQTSGAGSIDFGEANVTTRKNRIAQSFIPTKTKIRGIRLKKSLDLGNFTGTITINLQADVAGNPSGSNIASVTITNAQWERWVASQNSDFLFSSEYTGTIGTTYWYVFSTSTADNSNHPILAYSTTDVYANGQLKYNNTTDGWQNVTGDLVFEVLEGNGSQVVRTNNSGEIEGLQKAPGQVIYSTPGASIGGDSTTRFDITNTTGSIYRYTFDGTGTNPNITSSNPAIGTAIAINGINFNASNNGAFLVVNSGTNFFEVYNPAGVAENDKTLGTSGYIRAGFIYNKPTNIKSIVVEVIGAGGAGGGAAGGGGGANGGGGGGAGGYSRKRILASALNQSEPIGIGPGGTGSNGSGTNGGRTDFGSQCTGLGGIGGIAGSSQGRGGLGGTASGGDINIPGNPGSTGNSAASVAGGNGGGTYFGGAGCGGNSNGTFQDGTAGTLGAGGGGGNTSSGGGAQSGGAGGNGLVVITEFY